LSRVAAYLLAALVLCLGPASALAPGAPPAGEAGAARERAPSRSEEARWVEAVVKVTAYTAGPESTGKRPDHPEYGITASGVPVFPGAVAADPAVPFGTRVWIPGYGPGVVVDRGGAVRGLHLDVYLADLAEARSWGGCARHGR